jgi:hypothetical protein
MSEEKNIFKKSSKDFVESSSENKKRNNNNRNNALTDFFSSLLECNWFKILILSALTIVIVTFFMLSIFLGIFIWLENEHMIDVVLGILFKIFMPCAMIFTFFIKFGEYNKN